MTGFGGQRGRPGARHGVGGRTLRPARRPASLRLFLLLLAAAAGTTLAGAVEATLTDDACFGSRGRAESPAGEPTLRVRGSEPACYLKFDLAALPPEATGGDIARATLRLWTSEASGPGDLEIGPVLEPWSEEDPGSSSGPAYESAGSAPARARVSASRRFVTVDVTELVRPWVEGWTPNYGFALAAGSPDSSFAFDSKENRSGGHEPVLEIALYGLLRPQTEETPLDLSGPPGPAGPAGSEGPEGPPGSAGAEGAPLNPLRLALGRWDEAADTGNQFSSGTHPIGLVFDGFAIWAADWGSDAVRRINRRNGNHLGTVTVGLGPVDLAYDGIHVWVANYLGNSLTKLRARDGGVVATIPVGIGPSGLAFDGKYIWVAQLGENTVRKLRASDGATVGTFPVSGGPRKLAFDGQNLWLTCTSAGTLVKIRPSDGQILGTFGGLVEPVGLAFDGTRIWAASFGAGEVVVYRTSDGAQVNTIPVGVEPFGVAFDGTNVWVTNAGSDTVIKIRASDGSTISSYPVGHIPEGILFDGANIWVGNSRTNTLSRL